MNSSFVSPVSLIILFKSPLPISSPACTGTTVSLPSGCFRITWLPCVRTVLKPILVSALISFFAGWGFRLI